MFEIQDALNGIEKDDAIRVVVPRHGRQGFVAGGDISIMAKGAGYLDVIHGLPAGQQITWNIEHFQKPVIARITASPWRGNGAGPVLRHPVAADTAIMGVPEITWASSRLRRNPAPRPDLRRGHGQEAGPDGRAYQGRGGLPHRPVDMLVPKAELDDAVAKLAKRIASKSPIALAMGKEAINMASRRIFGRDFPSRRAASACASGRRTASRA